jgi:tRNA modification GTPase
VVSPFDTIVAPVTPPGRGGVSVVRVSGPEAWRIAGDVFSPWPPSPKSHLALYGRFLHGDDGMALPFEDGHGYTGERAVEFSVHGSPVSVRALVDRCSREGARLAGPGEFTLRAFTNGRLDLTQAEAIKEMIDARTPAQFRAACLLRQGGLRRSGLDALRSIESVIATMNAHVDFSEELGQWDREEARVATGRTLAGLDAMLARARRGVIWREGLRIALCGLPNAGKSSLLNALVGRDRAIVTCVPGTTRDTLEEMTDLGGAPCALIDTAGLQETSDPVEAIGVARAREAAAEADWVWYLYDCQAGWSADDGTAVASLGGMPPLILATKADLPHERTGRLEVSALTGQGFAELERLVGERAQAAQAPELCLPRHVPLLERAVEGASLAMDVLDSTLPPDLAVTGLSVAAGALGELLGEGVSVDLLDRMFADFCIGK